MGLEITPEGRKAFDQAAGAAKKGAEIMKEHLGDNPVNRVKEYMDDPTKIATDAMKHGGGKVKDIAKNRLAQYFGTHLVSNLRLLQLFMDYSPTLEKIVMGIIRPIFKRIDAEMFQDDESIKAFLNLGFEEMLDKLGDVKLKQLQDYLTSIIDFEAIGKAKEEGDYKKAAVLLGQGAVKAGVALAQEAVKTGADITTESAGGFKKMSFGKKAAWGAGGLAVAWFVWSKLPGLIKYPLMLLGIGIAGYLGINAFSGKKENGKLDKIAGAVPTKKPAKKPAAKPKAMASASLN